MMEPELITQSNRGLNCINLVVDADRWKFRQRSAEERVEMILQAEFEDAPVQGNA